MRKVRFPSRIESAQPNLRKELLFSVPTIVLILGLHYYWFAIADRYVIFLYYHDMGPLVPDTTPFGRVTSSRYWMTGLVAGGTVMVLYLAINFLLGRLNSRYRPPNWWRVWLLCAGPLLIGIPLITMTLNEPQLPWNLALGTSVIALIGLALALIPGRIAAQEPTELLLLTIDGLGLMFLMLNLISIERVQGWLDRGSTLYIGMMMGAFVAGLFLLTFTTVVRFWRQQPGNWLAVFLAGLCVSYLLMPAIHYLGFTDGYYYITDSDNFFALSKIVQILIWLTLAAITMCITRLRKELVLRRKLP